MNMGLACRKLKSLSLNSNKLSGLPDFAGVFLPSLEVLELNSNLIKKFPINAILNCRDLVELYLSDNPEFDDDIPSSFMDNNCKIEKFDFSKTSLSRLPKDLILASTLKRLNFSATQISCEHLEVIGGLQYLEEISLSKMNLSALPKALKLQHALHILNVD
jgi:Leucine-rich repeat (LRR) protein